VSTMAELLDARSLGGNLYPTVMVAYYDEYRHDQIFTTHLPSVMFCRPVRHSSDDACLQEQYSSSE